MVGADARESMGRGGEGRYTTILPEVLFLHLNDEESKLL